MPKLYTSSIPFKHGMLPVSDGHWLYYEQSGNPDGIPVLFIHGGPGAGLSDDYTRMFEVLSITSLLTNNAVVGALRPLHH